MKHYYTGVGSRKTPDDVLFAIVTLAVGMGTLGYTLRSGGAEGADTAFEEGSEGQCCIYLPWKGFNGRAHCALERPTLKARKMAATIHPNWEGLSDGAKALHARNCHQVLGDDLATPSDLLICWTPDGCESEATRTKSTGGTATAIVLADRHGIPIFNLGANDGLRRLHNYLEL